MNTPTPWKTALTPTGKLKIVDRNGFSIANLTSNVKTENEDNADKIVTCVNYHDRLISQLEDCIKELERLKKDEAFHFSCPLKKCKQLLTEIKESK